MATKSIGMISVLAAIALLGLIGTQLYWINNAFSLRQKHFSQNVSEALNNVVHKLEKHAAAAKIQRRLNFRKQGIRWLLKSDSAEKHNHSAIKIYEEVTTTDSSGTVMHHSGKKIISSDSSVLAGMKVSVSTNSREPFVITQTDSSDDRFQWFFRQSDMVSDIFDELISINIYKDYEEKVDSLLLDSVLKCELLNKGIAATYLFGVHNDSYRYFPAGISSDQQSEIMRSAYKINLAPDNVFIPPKYLSVYFPSEKNYILQTMWVMLTGSGVLILSLIFAFYYTVSTILKQKKLSEIKNDFINNMTHELKTPISTISLACEALGDDSIGKTKEKLGHYVGIIREENQRLGLLVENILQTAILDKGQFKLRLQKTDVHEIIERAISNIRLQVEKRKGKILLETLAEQSALEADRVHLTNIIYNLVDNALKYSDKNPEIKISTANVNGGLEISVSDNGTGISKENQKKIFETFFRVPTGNVHNVKGFGLGLSYVKAAAEKHGGSVSLESEQGRGSTFRVYLPLVSPGGNEK